MAHQAPIWPAAKLNELIPRVEDASVGLAPSGKIYRIDTAVWRRAVRSADAARSSNVKPGSIADVLCQKVIGLETATANLGSLPLFLSFCALDPESWCIVLIHPGAFEAVGPLHHVASPLREWLLRAVNSGQFVGSYRPELVEPSLKANRLAGGSEDVVATSELHLVTDELISTEIPLPELVPTVAGTERTWLTEHLESLDVDRLGSAVQSREDATALCAGVWQMNGLLDRSHELAQSVDGKGKNRAGDYWHAITHRREPDYSNARYWFRKVGAHAIHTVLARDANEILTACGSADAPRWRSALTGKGGQTWDALSFVDLCEHVANGRDAKLSLAARQMQLIEMALLLSSTYHDALGPHILNG